MNLDSAHYQHPPTELELTGLAQAQASESRLIQDQCVSVGAHVLGVNHETRSHFEKSHVGATVDYTDADARCETTNR